MTKAFFQKLKMKTALIQIIQFYLYSIKSALQQHNKEQRQTGTHRMMRKWKPGGSTADTKLQKHTNTSQR